jgi:hypothetical protein
VVRANGTALTRDLIYAPSLTFAVDLPNGTYDVTLTTGDTDIYPHDLMGVFLEGTQVATISTLAGQVVTAAYSGVHVNDGQLTLRLQDLGGIDANVVINGLQVIWAGPDTFGPRVIAASPSGNATAPVDRLRLTFDEPLLPGSFSVADIVSLTGPTGAIVPTAVQAIDATQFEVQFAAQNAVGDYRLTIDLTSPIRLATA